MTSSRRTEKSWGLFSGDLRDLYCASARKGFARDCAFNLFEDEGHLENCLETVILEIEKKLEVEIEPVKRVFEGKSNQIVKVQHFPEI